MEGVLQPFLCTWAWSQEKAIQVDFFLNELLCVLSLVAAHVNSGSEQWIRGHRAHKDSPSQMPSQQMIDEKYERLIGKPVNCLFLLVLSYLPLLPACFHAFLTERLVIHDLQVFQKHLAER